MYLLNRKHILFENLMSVNEIERVKDSLRVASLLFKNICLYDDFYQIVYTRISSWVHVTRNILLKSE